MNQIILYHHLGLGDHFICNGLVNTLSEHYDKIYLPCKSHYFISVNSLYQDNDKVEVCPIENESYDVYSLSKSLGIDILNVGFFDFNAKTFDVSFYEGMCLDFSLRHSNFKYPQLESASDLYNKLVVESEYCLVHDSCSTEKFNLKIDSDLYKIFIQPDITNNIMDYVEVILHAKEVHCVDSSIYQLVDSINTSAKLYFHNVRYGGNSITVSDKWEIINYG